VLFIQTNTPLPISILLFLSLCEPHTRVFCRWPWRAGAHLNTGARARNDIMELWTAVLVWAFGLRARACMRRRARSKRQTKRRLIYPSITGRRASTRLDRLCFFFLFFFIGFPHTRVFRRCPKKSKKTCRRDVQPCVYLQPYRSREVFEPCARSIERHRSISNTWRAT